MRKHDFNTTLHDIDTRISSIYLSEQFTLFLTMGQPLLDDCLPSSWRWPGCFLMVAHLLLDALMWTNGHLSTSFSHFPKFSILTLTTFVVNTLRVTIGTKDSPFFRWFSRNNQELGERIFLSDDSLIQGFMHSHKLLKGHHNRQPPPWSRAVVLSISQKY